jgi:hypothetical protein
LFLKFYLPITQNGHKHWMSQWFNDRVVDIPLWMIGQTGVKLRVAAFIDYSKLQQQQQQQTTTDSLSPSSAYYHIIVRINNELYLQYNFADSYNLHTDPEHANKLTIVQANSNTEVSSLKGSLEWGEQYLYQVDSSARNVVVKVCSISEDNIGSDIGIVRYTSVSIYYVDKNSDSTTIASQEYYCSMDDTVAGAFSDTSTRVAPTSGPILLGNMDKPTSSPKPYLPEVLGDDPTFNSSPTQNEGIFEYGSSNSSSNKESDTRILIPILISSIFVVASMIGLVLVLLARQKRKLQAKSESKEDVANDANYSKKPKSPKKSTSPTIQNIKRAIPKDSPHMCTTAGTKQKSTTSIPEPTESSTRDDTYNEIDENDYRVVVLSNVEKKHDKLYQHQFGKSREKNRSTRPNNSSPSVEQACRIIPRPGGIETVIATIPSPLAIDTASRYNQQNHGHDNAIRETRVLACHLTDSMTSDTDVKLQRKSSSKPSTSRVDIQQHPKRMNRSQMTKNVRQISNNICSDEQEIAISSKLQPEWPKDMSSATQNQNQSDGVDDFNYKLKPSSQVRKDDRTLNNFRIQI